jgi:hypothetical protein
VEFVVFAAPELDVLDVDCELPLGGGWLERLVLSLGGGGSGGGDEDGICLEMPPLVVFFGLLLVFPVGGRGYELSVPGGGGITGLGPFDGRYGVPSASEEG